MGALDNLSGTSDTKYCFQLSPNISEVIDSYNCAQNVRSQKYPECAALCPPKCYEINYPWSLSHSKWPIDPFSNYFYDTFIRNQTYEDRYVSLVR